jgi:hypothetical protein
LRTVIEKNLLLRSQENRASTLKTYLLPMRRNRDSRFESGNPR